jgi:hypothetical protein
MQGAAISLGTALVTRLGGTGLLFRPTTRRGSRPGKPPTYIQEHTMQRHLDGALRSCKLKRITWYEAARYTLASQWVLEGKPIGGSPRWPGPEEWLELVPQISNEANQRKQQYAKSVTCAISSAG